jgi:hypothetical protein
MLLAELNSRWSHVADGDTGEHWVRYAAGDKTTWYISTGPLDEDEIVMTAGAFGEMLARDVLPGDK